MEILEVFDSTRVQESALLLWGHLFDTWDSYKYVTVSGIFLLISEGP